MYFKGKYLTWQERYINIQGGYHNSLSNGLSHCTIEFLNRYMHKCHIDTGIIIRHSVVHSYWLKLKTLYLQCSYMKNIQTFGTAPSSPTIITFLVTQTTGMITTNAIFTMVNTWIWFTLYTVISDRACFFKKVK